MSRKLWFISEDDDLVGVFDDHEIAREELFYLNEDNPISKYKLYGLTPDELENYSDEYELAKYEGYVIVDKTANFN
jgi:hypothetical protein